MAVNLFRGQSGICCEMMSKPVVRALCFIALCGALVAQKPLWQPSAGHTQVPIWPGTPPDAQFGPPSGSEISPEPGEIDNVSRPTMTVYSPTGNNNGRRSGRVSRAAATRIWPSIWKARRFATG